MRKPRLLKDGARYHVYARANRKEMIMGADEMKKLFMVVIKHAKAKYAFRLENLCILSTHFHFIIQPTEGESLSSIMQWILSVFAMRFNRVLGQHGHVWGERFSSCIISTFKQYLEVFIYIDDNPRKAGLVDRAEDWPFGRFHLGENGWADLVECPSFALD